LHIAPEPDKQRPTSGEKEGAGASGASSEPVGDWSDERPAPALLGRSGSAPGAQPGSSPVQQLGGAGRQEDVDPMLLEGLSNSRNRLTILKYEDSIVRFMQSKEVQLDFPALPSYHRMIVHRISDRFGLERQSVVLASGAGQEARALMLFKLPTSRMPSTLLINMQLPPAPGAAAPGGAAPAAPMQPKGEGAPKIKLMKRDPSKKGQKGRGQASASQKGLLKKSVSEREKDYAAARARIFGGATEEVPARKASPKPDQEGADASSVLGNQARGPDGTPGFGAGRGRRVEGANGSAGSSSKPGSTGGTGAGGRGKASHRSSRESDGPTSKVQWRNRQAELYDPDFQRNPPTHPNLQPHFDQSFGYVDPRTGMPAHTEMYHQLPPGQALSGYPVHTQMHMPPAQPSMMYPQTGPHPAPGYAAQRGGPDFYPYPVVQPHTAAPIHYAYPAPPAAYSGYPGPPGHSPMPGHPHSAPPAMLQQHPGGRHVPASMPQQRPPADPRGSVIPPGSAPPQQHTPPPGPQPTGGYQTDFPPLG